MTLEWIRKNGLGLGTLLIGKGGRLRKFTKKFSSRRARRKFKAMR